MDTWRVCPNVYVTVCLCIYESIHPSIHSSIRRARDLNVVDPKVIECPCDGHLICNRKINASCLCPVAKCKYRKYQEHQKCIRSITYKHQTHLCPVAKCRVKQPYTIALTSKPSAHRVRPQRLSVPVCVCVCACVRVCVRVCACVRACACVRVSVRRRGRERVRARACSRACFD